MVDALVFGLCTAVGLGGTAANLLVAWRKRHDGGYGISRWARACAFAVCTIGVALAIPALADAVEALSGIHNLAKLGAHLCAVAWCCSLQIMLVDWAYEQWAVPTHAGYRIFLAFGVAAALVPLFIAASDDAPDITFTTDFAGNHTVNAYLLVYLSYVAVTCAELVFLCLKAGAINRRAGRRRQATGLTVAAVAALFGIGYGASKGSYLVSYTAGSPWSLDLEKVLSPSLSGIAIILLIVGLSIPATAALRRKASQQPDGVSAGV
ncbi:hypothetical protein [Kitasatospora acidiphila]|uniref:hypothetical protein n=1 Tax=Kitasatospora acidiphila TaxID=2567942 RepID=UPI0015EFEAD1|nr:hypothetical protein [Kitasatospora acidiphila]